MKKFFIMFSLITVFSTVVLFGYKSAVLAANQSEDAIPQSGDLCGGTNGNGKIVSVRNNSFALERNDGRNLIVNLTSRATIETSTGFASLSDLKTGDRVTLVGDDNRDGSFTADAVVVCNGMEESFGQENDPSTSSGQADPIIVRNNDTNYDKVSGAINTVTILLVGLIWLGALAFLKLKKGKGFVYLLFFTIFYIYLYKVLDYTLLQFQSLLLLKHFLPNLMLNGVEAGRVVNLIPLTTLTLADVRTSLLNILMMVPFGFGLPFITNLCFMKVVTLGLLLSIFIEFLQLATGFMANTTFRVADINDVIWNTIGVAIGYILFVRFVRRVSHDWGISTNPILRYITERPQVDKIKISNIETRRFNTYNKQSK